MCFMLLVVCKCFHLVQGEWDRPSFVEYMPLCGEALVACLPCFRAAQAVIGRNER